MIFPSIAFLCLFLPVFLLAYALLPIRNLTILALSLLFYAWGEGVYLLLLLATVAINYTFGQMIHRAHSPVRRYALWAGVGLNLLILFYYKYFGFLTGELLNLQIPADNSPHLPLGISFFIFQSISYLVDVYRKDSPPANSIFNVALYITMFPQLVAGPIVRYASISGTINQRRINLRQVRDGALLFVGGLCQKVLIANNAAEIADAAFSLPYEQVSTSIAWLGSAAYTLQIFFDFSGYSSMAIGIGLIMGFRFPTNFNYPYIARSITEFWRRWHMSLSSWFRDYVYIPLGGNRKGPMRTYVNLFVVFFLCGLWHGAAWTFVIWGIYHGILLVLERLALNRLLSRLPAPVSLAYTLFMVLIGWVLFRAESFEQAAIFIKALFGIAGTASLAPEMMQALTRENLLYCLLGIALSTPIIPRLMQRLSVLPVTAGHSSYGLMRLSVVGSMALLGFLLCGVYIYVGTYNPFIYFRF